MDVCSIAVQWGETWYGRKSAGSGTKGARKDCVQRQAFCHLQSGHGRVTVLCWTCDGSPETVTAQNGTQVGGWIFPKGQETIGSDRADIPWLHEWEQGNLFKLFVPLFWIAYVKKILKWSPLVSSYQLDLWAKGGYAALFQQTLPCRRNSDVVMRDSNVSP